MESGGYTRAAMPLKIVERLAVTAPMDPYLSLRALSAYCGLSVRTLREHINRLDQALPVYRIGSKIVVRRSEFDTWFMQFKTVGKPSLLAALNGTGLAGKYRLVDRPTPP